MTLYHLICIQLIVAVGFFTSAGAQTDNAAQPLPQDRQEALRLQLFLDQSAFKPGVVDGRKGEFTLKALHRYQQANGMKKSDDPKGLPLDQVGELYTQYQIQESDQEYVGSVPEEPGKMAKQERIPYKSLLEFVAERFHADQELLKTLNPGKNLGALKPGDTVTVPNVQPFEIEKLEGAGKADVEVSGDSASKIKVHVRTNSDIMELREGERLVGSYPITPGSKEKASPKGTWEVKFMAQMPTYRWDTAMFEGGKDGQVYTIPAGVNNPVGVIWMRLTPDGVGMHGTPEPETIGRAGSHGCIRLSNWDAIDLSRKISKGTTVVIE